MPYYRPRMLAQLTVPILGTRAQRIQQEKSDEEITLPLRPIEMILERNDHNEADACSVTCDWTDAGVDPRLLADGVLTVWLDNADTFGAWHPSQRNTRFVGMLAENDGERSEDTAGRVTLDAVDYTSVFLKAKPFGSSGIPDFSQTLEEGWRRIVEQTPGAEALADNLDFLEGVNPKTRIGDAVAERFSRLGQVPTKPETDAWAVWQQCVGMLGLVSYFELDRCVVTTATNLYSERDPPVLVWGRNLLDWRESRSASEATKGIGLTSFNPLSGTTIEAYYPPIGDPRVKRKRAAAKTKKAKKSAAAVRQSEDREYFPYPGVTKVNALTKVAQRVWEERSRQELAGSVSTSEMNVDTESGDTFRLLSIKAGDSVKIQIDQESRELLASLRTKPEQIAHLKARGYREEVARLIVANFEEFAKIEPKYYVKAARIGMTVDPLGGTFRIDLDYVNRIQLT